MERTLFEKAADELYKIKGPWNQDTEVITTYVGQLKWFYGNASEMPAGRSPI